MNYFKYINLLIIFIINYYSLNAEESISIDVAPKMVKIGETEFIFYMTKEKYQASKELIKSINDKKLLLVVEMYDDPYLTTEISAIASISPNADVIDPLGNVVLDQYAKKVIQIAKNDLNVEIEATSREINLIVSQDAHKFHQDQFKRQYEYLNANHDKLPKCKIIHDLTLIDWNMSKGTISGTIFQDEGGDRLLVALFPQSVVGIITAESPIYPENNDPPVFPGPISLPYHAVLSPIDFQGELSSGSSKGQRISTVVRGIVRDDAFKDIRNKAIHLLPYRPIQEIDKRGIETLKYENGILLKKFKNTPKIDLSWGYKMPDQENVEIVITDPRYNRDIITTMENMFDIKNVNISDVQVWHLIKKDGGFSKIDLMNLNLPDNSQIVLVNSSTLPKDYKYFNFSEDLTSQGYPWIHLYQFHPDMAMLVDNNTFKRLSLTPMEELIYRDEIIDNRQVDGLKMLPKLVTRIDVFVFPKS